MTLEIGCPNCRARLRVPDDAAGKQVRCPSCASVFVAESSGAAGSSPFAPPPEVPSDVNPYQPSSVADSDNPFAGTTPPGQLTPRTVEAFAATRPWVLFISVLGFLGAGLYGLLAIGILIGGMAGGRIGRDPAPLIMVAPIGLCAGLFFWISLLLWRYAKNLGGFRDTGDYRYLEQAAVAQCSYWKVLGVMVILSVLIGMAMPCLAGVFGAMAHR